jgi:glycosyltransferase involved in cell wall biosynthesis
VKIVVAIPVYDGKLHVNTVTCLLNEVAVASGSGDEFHVMFLPNCSVPAAGRNALVQSFMDSDSDKLIFLDSDITFKPGELIKLAYKPADLVGGIYRFKLPNECYPIGWLPDPELKGLQANEHGLLEVASLPTGFLCISRKVFETLKAAHPDREYYHMGQKAHCYFQMVFKDGGLYSEDSFFCREWREAGGKVYLDPEVELTHWDFAPVPFKGHIGNWLKSRPKETA